MQVDLKGQVALVTGGAQGIGRAIVESLAANGASVAILDLDRNVAQPAADELSYRGAVAVWRWAADVADARRDGGGPRRDRARAGPHRDPGQQRRHQHLEGSPADPRVSRRTTGTASCAST